MDLDDGEVVVTGGAGFIGSHLSERLLGMGKRVTVVDDLSNGKRKYVPEGATLAKADLTEPEDVKRAIPPETGALFHLASRKDVADEDPTQQYLENTRMTQNVLNTLQNYKDSSIIYASSSAVYGNAPRPTPEDHSPLEPISHYGASKLSEESLISVYSHSHGVDARCLRFANVVGPRLRNAVVPDFIEKLDGNPGELKILGDGRQEKSYIHVDDVVDVLIHVATEGNEGLETYNVGTETTVSVNEIADIVSRKLDVNPEYSYTGGSQGWTGDVPKMMLSIEKIKATGWRPEMETREAVERAVEELRDEIIT